MTQNSAMGFSSDEVVTLLLALEAAIMLADILDNDAERVAASNLRDRLVAEISTQLAMKAKSSATVQ